MFTGEHFIWIGLCAGFLAVMNFVDSRKPLTLKTAGWIMTVICAFSEISKMLTYMIPSPLGGMHLDPLALPLHLCSLMLFGVLYITFGPEGKVRQRVIDFIAVMGTLGSICAILIPTDGTDFCSILSYQCFVYHGGLLWFSVYLIRSGNAHLGGRTLSRNLGSLLVLVLLATYGNSILSVYDTNFMFLVRPPVEGLPYLNLDRGWYVYFFRILALGAGVISLFHLPFIRADHKTADK